MILFILSLFLIFSFLLIIFCNNSKILGVIYTTKIGMFLFQKTKEKGFSFYITDKDMSINNKKFKTLQVSYHFWDSQVSFISNNLKEVKPDPIFVGTVAGENFLSREQKRIMNSSQKEVSKFIKNTYDLEYAFEFFQNDSPFKRLR
jgi:hypothetical protein